MLRATPECSLRRSSRVSRWWFGYGLSFWRLKGPLRVREAHRRQSCGFYIARIGLGTSEMTATHSVFRSYISHLLRCIWIVLACCLIAIYISALMNHYQDGLERLQRVVISSAIYFMASMPLFAISLYRIEKGNFPRLFYETRESIRLIRDKFDGIGKQERIVLIFSLLLILSISSVTFIVPLFIDTASYPWILLALFYPSIFNDAVFSMVVRFPSDHSSGH